MLDTLRLQRLNMNNIDRVNRKICLCNVSLCFDGK